MMMPYQRIIWKIVFIELIPKVYTLAAISTFDIDLRIQYPLIASRTSIILYCCQWRLLECIVKLKVTEQCRYVNLIDIHLCVSTASMCMLICVDIIRLPPAVYPFPCALQQNSKLLTRTHTHFKSNSLVHQISLFIGFSRRLHVSGLSVSGSMLLPLLSYSHSHCLILLLSLSFCLSLLLSSTLYLTMSHSGVGVGVGVGVVGIDVNVGVSAGSTSGSGGRTRVRIRGSRAQIGRMKAKTMEERKRDFIQNRKI